jgi:streptogramin lyase
MHGCRRAWVSALFVIGACGQGGGTAAAGRETGPCVDGLCLGDLECLSDVCVDPDATGGGEVGPTGSTGTSSSSSGSTSTGSTSDDGTGTSATTTGPTACPDPGITGDDVEIAFIWIANSAEATVSKIDTRTGEEVARYATGPAEQGEPSRTSVSLYGDVAVSNRGAMFGGPGGVTKIAAREEDCDDRDGSGTIETSNGLGNVLPWGEDECVLWNRGIPSTQYTEGPRPTAWEGTLEDGCPVPNPRLWVGWHTVSGEATFHRLRGRTGAIEDTVMVAGNSLEYGPYGGAVDGNGDFWVIFWQLGPLVRIDGMSLDVERIEMPAPPADLQWAYGIALDQYGNPWIASAGTAAVYDVARGQWEFVSTGNASMRGVAVDGQNRAFFAVDAVAAGGCGVAVLDIDARSLLESVIEVPGCTTPVGVSIDVEGHIWVVDQIANAAFKLHRETFDLELMVTGLVAPYTYSDMTGAGLDLVVNPPG